MSNVSTSEAFSRLYRGGGWRFRPGQPRSGGGSTLQATNVTCATPRHSISCDIPHFDANASLLKWWMNEELPSRSYYSPDTTAISCLIRNDLKQSAVPEEVRNFTDGLVLQELLSIEQLQHGLLP